MALNSGTTNYPSDFDLFPISGNPTLNYVIDQEVNPINRIIIVSGTKITGIEINAVYTIIQKIEEILGQNPQGNYASVADKINAIVATVSSGNFLPLLGGTMMGDILTFASGNNSIGINGEPFASIFANDANFKDLHVSGKINQDSSVASGVNSTALGINSQALGNYSYSEGENTISDGEASHAEGTYASTYADYSHVEGIAYIEKTSDYGHAEGDGYLASFAGHAENSSSVYAQFAHGEGESQAGQDELYFNYNTGDTFITIGGNLAFYNFSTSLILPNGDSSRGFISFSISFNSFDGFNSKIDLGGVLDDDVTYGYLVGTQQGQFSHSEGQFNKTIGDGSHSEGNNNVSLGLYSHTEGESGRAKGEASHTEGQDGLAVGDYSHAENNSQAIGNQAHSEGGQTLASAINSHSEGYISTAGQDVVLVSSYSYPTVTVNAMDLSDYDFNQTIFFDNTSTANPLFGNVSNFQYPTILTNNALLAHYFMEDNAPNTIVIDNIGNFNATASFNTSGNTVVGQINNALSFDGITDAVVVSADLGFGAMAFSEFAWIKTTTDVRWIITHDANNGLFGVGTAFGGSHKLNFYDGITWHISTGPDIDDGIWHHVGIVRNEGNYILYVDGVAETFSGNIGLILTGPTYIGKFYNNNASNFEGIIDDVRFYRGQINQTDVDNIYNSGSGTQDEPALIGTTLTHNSTFDVNIDLSIFDIPNLRFVGTQKGFGAHVEGVNNQAFNDGSHAEGQNNLALGISSHVEGDTNVAFGVASHTEGQDSLAIGNQSHAEGNSFAYGENSHAENTSIAFGLNTHSEDGASAVALDSHAEGDSTSGQSFYTAFVSGTTVSVLGNLLAINYQFGVAVFTDNYSSPFFSVERVVSDITFDGSNTVFTIDSPLPVDMRNIVFGGTNPGQYSHAEGHQTQTLGESAHSEGNFTIAFGVNSHSEGNNTLAIGYSSHAEGESYTYGDYSHADGSSIAIGINSSASNESNANAEASHSEGSSLAGQTSYVGNVSGTTVSVMADLTNYNFTSTIFTDNNFAPFFSTGRNVSNVIFNSGTSTTTFDIDFVLPVQDSSDIQFVGTWQGQKSHAEGNSTQTLGVGSHSEGDSTIASGYASHAEGYQSIASGAQSHAEGNGSLAIGESSHAEGFGTVAVGNYSHAEGSFALAIGVSSHSEGQSNAYGELSHAANSSVSLGRNSNAINSSNANAMDSHTEGSSQTGQNQIEANVSGTTVNTNLDVDLTGYNFTNTLFFDNGFAPFFSEMRFVSSVIYASGTGTSFTINSTLPIPDNTNIYFVGTDKGRYSHAEGDGTHASGYASHSQGWETQALGNQSFAGGSTTFAYDENNLAFGDSAETHGSNSIAIGVDVTASGVSSWIFGDSDTVSGGMGLTNSIDDSLLMRFAGGVIAASGTDICLTSPDNNKWRLQVSNIGVLSVVPY